MIWLLDLADGEHRAALKYDLLAHGYRLEWLGTRRLPWGDAVTIVKMQPPDRSAVFRALHPDDYDRTRLVATVEMLAVIAARAAKTGATQTIPESQLPSTFSDLIVRPSARLQVTDEQVLAEMADIDRRLGVAGG